MEAKPDIVRTLLNYLIAGVQDRGGRPIKTQLVKLLYLVDLEYYRRIRKTVTGLEWIFYHYGPYAFAVEPILSDLPDVEEEEFRSTKGRRGFAYKSTQTAGGIQKELETYASGLVRRLADRVLDAWASENLWKLLDFVYFETEPMENATRGGLLDFTTVRSAPSASQAPPSSSLDKKTIAELKKLIEQAPNTARSPTPAPHDDVYWEAIRIMNEEDS